MFREKTKKVSDSTVLGVSRWNRQIFHGQSSGGRALG
jgi:hypothetical protein